MNLLDILDEISIGFNQNDKNSQQLKKHIAEVREILEKPDVLIENRSFSFDMLEDASRASNSQSQLFYQGSYAISTAIKHPKYEVDADIAFYVDDFLDQEIRDRIFEKLKSNLRSSYDLELKKPCIAIDFKDGFKVDVAIYSKSTTTDQMLFHNSIKGFENKEESVPKKVVACFSDYLKDNKVKRSVIRLLKHFSKQTGDKLKIQDINKIPSISYMLIAQQEFAPTSDNPSEENLKQGLDDFIKICKDFISKTQTLDNPSLLIGNTFYKIQDFKESIKVLTEISNQLTAKNYASLVSTNVFENISKRTGSETKSGLIGTMG